MSDYLLHNFRKLEAESLDVLKTLQLPAEDALTQDEDRRVRITNLDKAKNFANNNKVNTYVVLKCEDGMHKFKLNILGNNGVNVFTTEKFMIPIKNILSVDIS